MCVHACTRRSLFTPPRRWLLRTQVLGNIDTNALKLLLTPSTTAEPERTGNGGVPLWGEAAVRMLPAGLVAGLASLGFKLPERGDAKGANGARSRAASSSSTLARGS